MIKTIEELPVAKGRLFLRADFNLPRDSSGKFLDETRLTEALPTIRYLLEQKASLIIGAHLGRPKGHDPKESLIGVAERLSELLRIEVLFPEDCVGDAARKLAHDLREGQLMLLENLRFHKEEEANDPQFAKMLASLAEVYVTDAFGTLHRAHASTAGMVSHFKHKGIGFLVKKEIDFLQKILEAPTRPFFAVLGGAKVSDKIGVIESLLRKVDGLLIGGGMAYTFLKALGRPVGRSKVEEEKVYAAKKILDLARERNIPVELPSDHVVADEIAAGQRTEIVKRIPDGKRGLDIGPETTERYRRLLSEAKTIFWNGPMGVFEIPEFAAGTTGVAKAIAGSGAVSVVGGGESVTAVRQAGVAEKITHLSTGGGATLEYLEGIELPGLRALQS